jgi:hypothetical protein
MENEIKNLERQKNQAIEKLSHNQENEKSAVMQNYK